MTSPMSPKIKYCIQYANGRIDESVTYDDRKTAAWITKVRPQNGYRLIKILTIYKQDDK